MVRVFAMLGMVTVWTCGCGSGPAPKPPPAEPPPAKLVQVPVDAGVPVDAPPPPPKLVCDGDSVPTPAPAPEPTWFCARPDGTRDGPFLTLFPDDTIEVTGHYKNGTLDGSWERHHPDGTIALAGQYAGGKRTGRWTQTSTTGTTLGTFELANGTGIEKRWLDGGELYSETTFKGDVRDGVAKVYAKNGYVLELSHYRAGKLYGTHRFGTKNTLRFEERFWRGIRYGQRKIYQHGELLADENFDRSGRFDGPYTIWRSRKVIRVQGVFEKNRRTGTWVWNDRDGKKEREGNYVRGQRDGEWNEWDDEKLTWTGTYDEGKPNGTFIYYDRNGNELGKYDITDGTGWVYTYWSNRKPASKTYLYKGHEAGLYRAFTRHGRVVEEGHYSWGKKHGRWRTWTPDRVLTLEQHWKHGKLDGVVKKFVDGTLSMQTKYVAGKAEGPYAEFRLGKPSLSGQFAKDLRTGTWTSYNAEGRVVRTATYKDGILEGPYRELLGDGTVLEGTMVAGRRDGTWTRTDKGGSVRKLTYRSP